ncbi:MAG: amidohydrolase family protein [Nitrospirota bacterium]
MPTRLVSNGEFVAPRGQGAEQLRVERAVLDLAERLSPGAGMTRRRFLGSACGMAAAFMAMNSVYGELFSVDPAEAAEPDVAAQRIMSLRGQFVFDVQTHFVRDEYSRGALLGLRRAARRWNPVLAGEEVDFGKLHFENYIKEIFLESDTSVALLSSAPADREEDWFLRNEEIDRARSIVNGLAGSRRLLSHAVFAPGMPGWMEALERAIALRPDSWKGYTVGDPLSDSRWPWRMDDEELVYPAYQKMLDAGIGTVCVHKGLLPPDYEESFPNWRYGGVDDVARACRDWPDLKFVIYHSAIRALGEPPERELSRLEETGEIPWVSDLARIPGEHGVENLYAELGTVFGAAAVSHPRYCAGILGTLIKGFGPERVLWGTDSVWYGSPQWQIEAFRRIEIPPDLRERMGFAPLGPADGRVKNLILGGNAERLYGLEPSMKDFARDGISRLRDRPA